MFQTNAVPRHSVMAWLEIQKWKHPILQIVYENGTRSWRILLTQQTSYNLYYVTIARKYIYVE